MKCPSCNLEQSAGVRFCEDCGARLEISTGGAATVAAGDRRICPHCGAAGAANDGGFCPKCGLERKSLIEDHLDVSATADIAGVSDRGRQRVRNEDFVAVGPDVLVVCDGVSQSQQPDRAARGAATCVRDELVKAAGASRAAMLNAITAADAIVRALPSDASNPGEPAETTIVAAARRGGEITLGWLGDSRAYWAGPDVLRQLTVDHSWVNEIVARGDFTREQALRHPNAHAITRTLGGPVTDKATDEPSVLQLRIGTDLTTPGWLLLCTDGFWDCAANETDFAEFMLKRIRSHPPEADALSLARLLVQNACELRGHDNVTVGLLAVRREMTA